MNINDIRRYWIEATLVLSIFALCISVCISALGCGEAARDASAPAAEPNAGEAVEYFEGTAGGEIADSESFPEDLPLYPQARPTAQVASPQHGRMLMFSSPDDPAQVLDHFRTAWTDKGWRVAHETDLEGERLIAFVKGNRRASVAVGETKGGSRITVAASDPGTTPHSE